MTNVVILLIATIGLVRCQTPTTPMPANFTFHPTDIPTNGQIAGGLILTPLVTQGYSVEYPPNVQTPTQDQYLGIPCQAVANPQRVEYAWYKWSTTSSSWMSLMNTMKTSWSGGPNGDPNNFGMLTIRPYDKVADAGAYVCWAKTDYATSVSRVLNLTAANYAGEGVQAKPVSMSADAGSYVKLATQPVNAFPYPNASWTRSSTSQVTGAGNEIPPDRVIMDENNILHIGFFDNTVLQAVGPTGLVNYNNFFFKYLSLRFTLTYVNSYQLTVTGTAPTTTSCKLMSQTTRLNLIHGQNSRIACVYVGSPNIKVYYLKVDASGNPQPLTTQVFAGGDSSLAIAQTGLYGNTYMIGTAQPTDAGTYKCMAKFSNMDCTDQAQPIVVTVDMEPIFVMQPNPVSYVVEGQTVTLEWRIKGRPKPTIEVGQNGLNTLPADPKIRSQEQDTSVDPADGMTVYKRTFQLTNAVKPSDSRSVQVFASNAYYRAISSVALTVISPISFPNKMTDQLALAPGSKAVFTCIANGDDSLPMSVTWTRFFLGVTYPITDAGQFNQYSVSTNDVQSPAGLRAYSQSLTVDTSLAVGDQARGQYACNVTNVATWNVTSGRLSFVGDDPVAAASFEMWMLGPILGGVAAILLVVGIIIIVRRNRGEKYEVEDEEIKKGYDPKKEAHEQRELREYQRDREKDAEPLRKSQPSEIEHEDEA